MSAMTQTKSWCSICCLFWTYNQIRQNVLTLTILILSTEFFSCTSITLTIPSNFSSCLSSIMLCRHGNKPHYQRTPTSLATYSVTHQLNTTQTVVLFSLAQLLQIQKYYCPVFVNTEPIWLFFACVCIQQIFYASRDNSAVSTWLACNDNLFLTHTYILAFIAIFKMWNIQRKIYSEQ